MNFLNRKNAADVRVYELLREKFKLFDGVFGASDEVLGAIESDVEFEKRIASIYQNCRTPEQIAFEFDQLQKELESDIAVGRENAQQLLLSNFDQEVVERVRIASRSVLDRFNDRLWEVTRHSLRDHADFEPCGYGFMLHTNPFANEPINPGPYRMGKDVEDANTYRVGHPLAQKVLERAKATPTPPRRVSFRFTGSGKNIAILDDLKGQSGWMELRRIEVRPVDDEDRLVFGAMADSGERLDSEQCRRLYDLPAIVEGEPSGQCADMTDQFESEQQGFLNEIDGRNRRWFAQKTESVEAWAADKQALLSAQVAEAEQAVSEKRKAARLAQNLPEQVHSRKL